MDSISYELMNEVPMEVWKCAGACARYRHRRALPGLLPAVCCGKPAKSIDRYSQPTPIVVEHAVSTGSAEQ